MHHLARALVPGPLRGLLPKTSKRVVVVGGGPTGLFCADRLRHHFEVTLVDGKEYFEFALGILRAAVDPSHHSRITFGYQDVLERDLGVEFVLGHATRIDSRPAPSGCGRSGGVVHVAGASGPARLHFDYCVVAVGASNGLWKPRLSPDSYAGVPSAGPAPPHPTDAASWEDPSLERSLEARRYSLQSLRGRIAGASGVTVVGAGLVGVELAADIAHFFPGLKVTLANKQPDVLPQLGDAARQYARNWLLQHNVSLELGRTFVGDNVPQGHVVLHCGGARPRAVDLFADRGVLRRKGQIRVNRFMQVLRQRSLLEAPPDGDSAALAAEDAEELLAGGRVFAVGDAAAVDGVPTAKMICHGEEMAAVAVAKIEAGEGIADPLEFLPGCRVLEPDQPALFCTTLGPHDGMVSTQSELLATGPLAAMQKQLVEVSKMRAFRGELASSMLWYPMH